MRFHSLRVYAILPLLLIAGPGAASAAPILQFTMGGRTWCQLTSNRECGLNEVVAFQFRIDPAKITITRDIDVASGLIYGTATFVLENVTPLRSELLPPDSPMATSGYASYGYQIAPDTGQASIGRFQGSFYGSGWGREFVGWDTSVRVLATDLEASAYWGWTRSAFEYYDWISTPGFLGHVGAVAVTNIEPIPEPATLCLIAGGLVAGFARYGHRRRKPAQS